MAALDSTSMRVEFSSGLADKIVLYSARGVTAGDTFDCAGDLKVVKRAVAIGATVAGQAVLTINAPSTITIPNGINADAAWVLAYGVAN